MAQVGYNGQLRMTPQEIKAAKGTRHDAPGSSRQETQPLQRTSILINVWLRLFPGPVIVEITGYGPSGVTYVNPMDDPEHSK